MPKKRHILVAGAGFGGVKAALELAKNNDNDITVVSENDYFQYYPALYSAATGHSHKQAWVGLDTIFEDIPNITVKKDTLTHIDVSAKMMSGTSEYRYDKAVVALGSVTTYFGIEGLDTYAFGIKTQTQIRQLQAHLFNEMSDGHDTEKNYVIIGGGPTGVELAGALGEYLRVLRSKHGISKKTLRIVLIEAAPTLLPRMSPKAGAKVAARLRKLGVVVETNKKVERQTAKGLVVNGKPLMSQTVIWTSGVTNAPFFQSNKDELPLDERGKVIVDEYLRSSEHVYVIGDNAATPYSGLAQTALHDALFVTKHLNGSRAKYSAKLPPCVVPVGKDWAVFEWGKLHSSGYPASFMRTAADFIGYKDILPIGYAFKAWRSQSKREDRIPERIGSFDK